MGLCNSSGRSSLGLRSLWVHFKLRDRGLSWFLITKTERTVFATQHNRHWDSLWPRDSAASRRQLQMVRYGSFASPYFLSKMPTLNSKLIELIFSIFHHKIPSLEAEQHSSLCEKSPFQCDVFCWRNVMKCRLVSIAVWSSEFGIKQGWVTTDAFSPLFSVPDKG